MQIQEKQKLNIEIKPDAIKYFEQLISEQEQDLNLRLAALNPGSANAEISLTFCYTHDIETSDIAIECGSFILYVDALSKHALQEAKINYVFQALGQRELLIQAPHIYGSAGDQSKPILERLEALFEDKINNELSKHSGHAKIKSFDKGILKIQFFGGCQGCSMAHVTLKNSIEKKIKRIFPEVIEVLDVTSH